MGSFHHFRFALLFLALAFLLDLASGQEIKEQLDEAEKEDVSKEVVRS
jgi:hypothetical protein